MRGWIVAIIAVVAVVFVLVVLLGVLGVISVPLLSPSAPSAYASSTEISYASAMQYIPQSGEYPSLDEFQSYGLDIHVYGTDDTGTAVRGYYESLMASWSEVTDDSGPGWSYRIWRSNLYGFGLAVYDATQVKQLSGYDTVFITVDGPASAWAPVFLRFT